MNPPPRLGRRWPRRQAGGAQDSAPQHGQAPPAQHPAAQRRQASAEPGFAGRERGPASHGGRAVRLVGTLVVTGLCLAYLLWKIDISRTAHILVHADVGYFLAALALFLLTIAPMAWRWQRLLEAKGIRDSMSWLTRAYLVAYTAGQVLPTAVGGDAVRIYETTRRHPGNGGPIAGSVILERALGGAATLVLAGIGFLLAIGRYDIGAYLWIEGAFVVATIVLAVALFSVRVRPLLARTAPLLRRVWLERPVRAVYEGIHSYRDNAGLLLGLTVLTLAIQSVRVLTIWLTGKAVGIDLSPQPYFVLGPLLFLVMLVPFTINGIAVRESFFVSFLGKLDVGADAAFACGFLFFVITLAASLPGAFILGWQSLRGLSRPGVEQHG